MSRRERENFGLPLSLSLWRGKTLQLALWSKHCSHMWGATATAANANNKLFVVAVVVEPNGFSAARSRASKNLQGELELLLRLLPKGLPQGRTRV